MGVRRIDAATGRRVREALERDGFRFTEPAPQYAHWQAAGPGVSVTFAVATGGGSVTGGSATTDATGIATVGSWTLGTTAGTRWGVSEGDYVALEEYLPCGHCEYCRSGEYRSCLEADFRVEGSIRYGSTRLGVFPSLYGGHSQFLYLHPRSVIHKVPEGIPPHIAAMALPLGNGFQWACFDGDAADALARPAGGHIGGSFVRNCDHVVPVIAIPRV